MDKCIDVLQWIWTTVFIFCRRGFSFCKPCTESILADSFNPSIRKTMIQHIVYITGRGSAVCGRECFFGLRCFRCCLGGCGCGFCRCGCLGCLLCDRGRLNLAASRAEQAGSKQKGKFEFVHTHSRMAVWGRLPPHSALSLDFQTCRRIVGDLLFVGGLVGCLAEQDAVLIKGGVRGHEFFLLVGAHCCNRVKAQR